MKPDFSAEDIGQFRRFLDTTTFEDDVQRELCQRVLGSLGAPARLEAISGSDLVFLRSWLKAGDLILAGLQFLELADESTAASVRHERECTQTALTLIPLLLDQAEGLSPEA